MALKLQNIYIQLRFSSKAAMLLVREQGLDNPYRLRVLMDKNVDDICNVMRKPGKKNANRTPNRGLQVSVIAQENLKLAAFLFHHLWRCTLDWEITGVNEEMVCFLVSQKKLKDEYKDPNVLLKINKSDMVGNDGVHQRVPQCTCGIIKAPLAYVIRKTITVQTYGDYLRYATPDNEMIARMLHLPSHKNKLQLESSVGKVKDHMAEFIIDKRMVYDILDQI